VTSATLDAALADTERILIDSSTLIAFHEGLERAHPLAVHVLDRISAAQDPLRACYSVITASELLVRPLRAGYKEFTFMHTFLTRFPNLTLLPMDLAVATQAATLRSIGNTRLPDAIIIASGQLAGCEAIISNDAAWKRRFAPLFPQFRWIYLGDHLPA
jgi:predicted nucleic acid-binding protein